MRACPHCAFEGSEEYQFCPICGHDMDSAEEKDPEPTAMVMVMAGVGAMLAFFGLAFGLVAAIAAPEFAVVSLVALAIAVVLFVLAWRSRKGQLAVADKKREKIRAESTCQYCGAQNREGAQRCYSCGAPLR